MAMMNRRGMLRAHSHWRPKKTRQAPPAPAEAEPARAPHQTVRKRALLFVGCAVAAGGTVGITRAVTTTAERAAGPATPTAWIDSFTAAVARQPQTACAQLVTPGFREALVHDLHESCAHYYAHVRVGPIRILRILESRETAAVEIRYWPHGSYWTFVLDRDESGWVGVAIVPGGPLPIA